MAWVWDAPAGVYKDHVLSTKLRRQATADAQIFPLLRPEPGYGPGKGQSITITRVLNLPLGSKVSETDRLPSGRPAIETKAITPSEWGYKIPLTEFEEDVSSFNLADVFKDTLRDQIRLTMDKMAADELKTTPYKYIPTAAGGVFDTDGTPSTTADKNLTVDDIRKIVDELSGTLLAPPFRNGMYVGILSTKAARGLKSDPEYKDWLAPSGSSAFTSGQIKDFENVSFIVTNSTNVLSNSLGSGGVLGEALFLAADPAALAIIRDPELRMGLPDQDDLGRFRQIGWVGTIGAGLIWEKASMARVIHVTSA